MCDICGDVLTLLQIQETRTQENVGQHLTKEEIFAVASYASAWQSRQCMCVFKDPKNFERLNNLVQIVLNQAISLIPSLPEDFMQEQQEKHEKDDKRTNTVGTNKLTESKVLQDVDTLKSKNANNTETKQKTKDSETLDDGLTKSSNSDTTPSVENESEKITEDTVRDNSTVENIVDTDKDKADVEENVQTDHWSIEEKDKLLLFVSKLYLVNFPLYMAYKHTMHTSIEELSQQETSALNSYCDLTFQDAEIPVYLLRNVCFFCDSNGIQALKTCFDNGTPDSLPIPLLHTLVNVIANLRLWMNVPTVVQYITPLKSPIVKYMCKLSDKDLRLAGNRNLTDLLWTALREPMETNMYFDKEGLELAFKYFTCTTLTLRLTGIAQINNHINNYNEVVNSENVVEPENVGCQLADWLTQNKIIQHIFGPNLHVEIIKQSQIVLNFLAIESRVTEEHIDSIWSAAQLKHCSRQVQDLLIALIKNLEINLVQYLLKLVSSIEPQTHNEQTLCLASALIKAVWSSPLPTHMVTLSQQSHQNYTALAREQEELEKGLASKHDVSSSDETGSSDDLDEGHMEIDQHNVVERESCDCSHHQTRRHHHRHVHHRHHHEGDGGSLCANSELSNISEDSLPSDMFDEEEYLHTHAQHHEMGTDSGEESEKAHALHRHMIRRARRVARQHAEDEEEDEEDEESWDEDEIDTEEELLQEQARLLRLRQRHRCGHRRGHTVETESSKEEECSDEESEMETSHENEKSDQVKVKLIKVPKTDGVQRNTQKPMPKSIAEQRRNDSQDEAKKSEVLKDVKKTPSERDSEGIPADSKSSEPPKVQHKPGTGPSRDELSDDSDTETKDVTRVKNAPITLSLGKKTVKRPGLQQRAGRKLMPKSVAERKQRALMTRLKRIKEQCAAEEEASQSEPAEQKTDAQVSKDAEIGEVKVTTVPNQEMETEVFDCRGYLDQLGTRKDRAQQEDFEDILSPEGSFNSSRGSTKSEKNMADFEGEVSDEELLSAHYKHHMQHHMASIYHSHIPTVVHEACANEVDESAGFDDVCGKGKTLLWDLVQDDKAPLLPEGLAIEAEKILCSLVCFSTDRRIRMRFIEACIKNIAYSRSVVISLRLLPKLFGSFQQYRSGLDTHAVTMWAEKELGMMSHFFNNLICFKENMIERSFPGNLLYSYKEEIYVRLQFLTCVYSMLASPEDFTMSLEQVDVLWNSLVVDPESSDECLNWFLNQAKTKDHHALKLETFKHLFMEKMPTLKPETMSMVGLNLFQQLCHLARCHNASLDNPLPEDRISGMDQLWGIALRANNTDVSISAIQYINCYYIGFGGGNLNKEKEFIKRCMHSLMSASALPEDKSPGTNLMIIQRGLILLKNHLEGFKKRFSFHLRNWQLDGKAITSHQVSGHGKGSSQIRITLQPAGMPEEKATVEMSTSDMVGDLRAEVTRWWLSVQKRQKLLHQQQQEQSTSNKASTSSSMLTPLLGAMLGDGPVRMITLGQELNPEMDEKVIGELQIKDQQIIFVSTGANRSQRSHSGGMPACYLPAPDRELTPMMILLEDPYFGQLFGLLQLLSNMKCTTHPTDSQERSSLENKARILSRKVWELLMLLPTNPRILEGFQALLLAETPGSDGDISCNWQTLLDPHNPHKLMYSLQVVEFLSKIPRQRRKSMVRNGGGDSFLASTDSELSVDLNESPEEIWRRKFINKGGLSHLFNIFALGSLQIKDGDHWCEWNQECLAYLLRLVSLFAVTPTDDMAQDEVFESTNYESPRKRMRKNRTNEKIIVPLNQTILSMMKVEPVLKILTTILYDAALPSYSEFGQMQTWGRSEVVHYAMSFLVSWAYSCDDVIPALCMMDNCSDWLKRLTVDAPEPTVRCEACKGLYKLCLGRTTDGRSGYKCLLPFVSHMLKFLPTVLKIKVHHEDSEYEHKEKEPLGPGCRDYFWLLSGLVENINKEDISQSYQQDNLANLDNLANHITKCIREREFYETRYSMAEDHVLIGLLQLCTVVIKLNPPFKCSQAGQDFLLELFWCLFALPSPNQRHLPKCKSQAARSATYDLIVELTKGNMENYSVFHAKVLDQHTKDVHSPYPWDHWPHEDGRSNCGYVGLTNLGATCYLATCMQHLYMIPQARQSVLQAKCSNIDLYEGTLVELQKMFAYLLESERKAYNPKSFCKVYTMDKQPLNTGEQKDMTEFFTDLISKLEEMSPDLKLQVKGLFGGILTNNVVSLDCPHVSRTLEEFYTVRCQVADMKNLYDSLDEVTVKDTLEGDNMYTCSTCQKKVRAEKRACFKKLPKILCFNTMRYTFNMLTMMKEKVNTHFSFPLRLDMSDYMEKNLMKPDKLEEGGSMDGEGEINKMEDEGYEYELIGVTVHTGTADGGHYYSFIRDRINKPEKGPDKWYLFNDAEVKPFDATQIASECFGGEMMSKTYDSMTDKFMDFSFEKTNSAYMLFYERISHQHSEKREETTETLPRFNFELSKDLADWIWQDNMHFLQDKNLFEHTYFSFMWQMCGYIPTTLPKDNPQRVSIMASQLSTSFVLETLIHAKEKPTMLQWIELLTKQFNSCQAACEWFLDHMSKDDWWPQQILIRCPNQVVRKMFQRLVTHVVTQLRPAHASLYLHPLTEATGQEIDTSKIGDRSCVTRFIKKMLSIIEHGVNSQSHTKYLSEYFDFLFEFAKQGDVESLFLIHIHAISTMVNFYMAQKTQENYVELSDDDEDEDVIPITEEKFKPVAFEKMIALISLLVESSRGDEKLLSLPEQDYTSIIGGGKGFNFLFHQIKDGINLHKTSSLIFSLCRWNDRLAMAIIQMIFSAITKLNGEQSQPFFRLLTLLTEFLGGPPGHPPFTNYILQKFWDVTEFCPQQCLDWLSSQVIRNKIAHAWVLNNLEVWVDQYLIAHSNLRVRNAASYLLVSLVPSQSFRQASRSGRSMISPQKELQMSAEALHVLHEIYEHLLRLLNAARLYADAAAHETTNLVAYFALLTVCLVSKTEKLMFTPYFLDLWQLFQPKLSEPPIAINHNKQALLVFWYQVCCDCPENVKLIVSNSNVTKNIAFNYILADHDDQDVVLHNRCMLPAYYGILRLCCQQSRQFTRLLAQHQNIQWAFKNITPYIAQYTSAVDELFRIMRLMVSRYEDSTEDELKAIAHFRQNTILLYVQNIDARSGWQTLVTALKILVETTDDRLLIVFNQGLHMFNEAFNTLHAMYHEATACHVTGELIDLLTLLIPTLKAARHQVEKRSHGVGSETKACLMSWKERMDFVRKLLALLNSYTPPEVRQVAIDTLKEMLLTYQSDSLQTIVPCLYHSHSAFQENNSPVMGGPFFPRRGQKLPSSKSSVRPPRPQFHMMLRNNQLECAKGIDEDYDEALQNFFLPYHLFVDFLCRVAVNQKNLNETVINLSAMVAYEAVPLHSLYFAKLWYEIYHSEHIDKTCINTLCNSNCFIDYVDAVLLDERQSLNNQIIYQFFCNFFPKVYKQVLNDQGSTLIDSLVASLTSYRSLLEDAETDAEILNTCHKINGDLRAMLLIFSVQPPSELTGLLNDNLHFILDVSQDYQKRRAEKFEAESEQPDVSEVVSSTENDPEETPPKKRKLDNEEQQPSSTNKNKDGEKSDINDQEHGEHNKDTNVAKTGHSSSQGQTSGKEQTSKCESSQKECSKQTEVKKDSNKAIREKPNAVDQTTKQILTLFSMVNKQKNKGESSQAAL